MRKLKNKIISQCTHIASHYVSLLLIVFPVAITTFALLFIYHHRLQVTSVEYRAEDQTEWQTGEIPLLLRKS